VNCTQPGCTGQIDADGYCNVCGVKAKPAADPASAATSPVGTAVPAPVAPSAASASAVASSAATTALRRTTTAATTSSPRNRLGAGLVEIPTIPEHDPGAVVLENPVVPETKRFCPIDGEPVGRSQNGTAGRTEGYCRKCGQPYSFKPNLRPGDVVGGQYEVVGCLAHGGLGWIYLARDQRLEQRWVVLKGLLNTRDSDALAAALSERRFLATVEHSDIVKIFNVAEHGSDGYIVMEYVRGKSLRQLLEEHRSANGNEPIPVAHAIAYILEILPALGYLHRRGLLFCDFKPDNVMQTGSSLKLIDLGGVYRMDDASSPIYGTRGYQAPEIAETGPTVPSDLFTVGRTLAVLCTTFRGYQGTYQYTLPPQADVPLYATYDSLYRFLERATAANPDDRFQSAEEMAGQLFGVLREVVARESGKARPAPSTLFTGELRSAVDEPYWLGLPALLVSADDAASGYLATLAATALDPAALVDELARAPMRTVEVELRRARALLEAGHEPEAAEVLDSIAAEDPWEWRVDWCRGLVHLALDEPAQAVDAFTSVYSCVPGELAPKLAVGYAAERTGDLDGAIRCYDIVSRTDPGFTSASFGLARCLLARGDRAGAIAAYDRVLEESSAYVEAQIARAEVLLDGDQPSMADVVAAATIVQRTRLTGEVRARLTAAVLGAALPLVHANGVAPPAPNLLGYPLTEDGVRLGLETTYRDLARHARTAAERIELVDRANELRPRTIV
jgi:serine/threonine-protein kinase PknG